MIRLQPLGQQKRTTIRPAHNAAWKSHWRGESRYPAFLLFSYTKSLTGPMPCLHVPQTLWARLWKTPRNAGKNALHAARREQPSSAANPFTSSGTHTAQSSASQTLPRSSAKLVNLLVETFSPLLRAPGTAAAKQAGNRPVLFYETAARSVGRTISARAALHTSARSGAASSRAGFNTVRPRAVPRGTDQIGLAAARNFSSARPVFQNVVQNAPLGLRVLGDSDRLDMRKLKKDMKAAILRARAEKGKGVPGSKTLFQSMDISVDSASMAYYFSQARAARDGEGDSARTEPIEASAQLVLPLNPVTDSTHFLSYDEDAEQSKFFSAMLMSDLRMLSELHGMHHARMRNLIHRLESAGCFEPNATGFSEVQAHLDEIGNRIVVTFYGPRWSMADVKQVLGYYDGPTWFNLVDLRGTLASRSSESFDDESRTVSPLPSDFGDDLSPTLSESERLSLAGSEYGQPDDASVMLSNDDDVAEHDRTARSMHIPSLQRNVSSTASESYVWGVEDFISGLEREDRPSFAAK